MDLIVSVPEFTYLLCMYFRVYISISTEHTLFDVFIDIQDAIMCSFSYTLRFSTLGPVVQSIVSLTSSLVVKMSNVLVSTLSNSQVF